ncbi:MAG: TlpA disulfide reductase family protein [Eubacteriales bacterium]|jgi:thiol-disulfide isomerase/thioredoxin|nr:TlpA disulfide reductase family protein [Eubacteriales bacterium]
MKKIALMISGILAAALLLSACVPAPVQAETTPVPEVAAATEAATEPDAAEETGDALEFSLTTLTGDTLDQTVFTENKLIMVNYWATWCGPCVSEIPDLIKISEDYADKGFVLIGVLTGDDDIDGAKSFIADQGVSYPVVLPEAFFLNHVDSIYAIPTTMFFNAEGEQINAAVVGAKSYEDWAGLIDLLLGQVS